MINLIKRLKQALFPPTILDPKDSFSRGILPCCGGTQYYEGPRGGLSQNIQCANEECGQRWNIAIVNGHCIMADKI